MQISNRIQCEKGGRLLGNYAILRFKKCKSGAAGIQAHNERQKKQYMSNPDINIERSHMNIHFRRPEDSYNKVVQKRIKEAGCKVRSNSVKFVDTVMTASDMFFKYHTKEECDRFFELSLSFMKDKVGEENIISAVVHVDEATPHMHLVYVPITKDNRLSAKDIIGGPSGLRKWQDDYHKVMSREFPNILRGKDAKETGRKHLETDEFKELAKQDGTLNQMRLMQELKAHRRMLMKIPPPLREEVERYMKGSLRRER